ncbi:hypothetical protein KCP69_26935 (plasmid) [Salmonella enterica subsp. enterica]|nr:hypothetical protein KCP69_26935 [Salmonella enterica subsp. enterica]
MFSDFLALAASELGYGRMETPEVWRTVGKIYDRYTTADIEEHERNVQP